MAEGSRIAFANTATTNPKNKHQSKTNQKQINKYIGKNISI